MTLYSMHNTFREGVFCRFLYASDTQLLGKWHLEGSSCHLSNFCETGEKAMNKAIFIYEALVIVYLIRYFPVGGESLRFYKTIVS